MISGWRLVGILTFLVAQTALAGFLGFIANLQRDEVSRWKRHLALYPTGTYAEAAARRLHLETAGVIADAIAAVGLAGVVLVSTAELSAPAFIRTIHRFCAWICFGFAALFLAAAIMTPRVGSPHDDMFPSASAIASTVFAFLAGLASLVIARLARFEPRM